MTPAVGHVLPITGEDLHRLGGLIEGDAQGAANVTGEKGVAVPGVEQHEHPPSVLHLVLDGVDFDLAEKLAFVVGLETRQLLGRRFHARTSWLSMEPFSPHLPPTDIDPARSVARVYRDDGTERIVTADPLRVSPPLPSFVLTPCPPLPSFVLTPCPPLPSGEGRLRNDPRQSSLIHARLKV